MYCLSLWRLGFVLAFTATALAEDAKPQSLNWRLAVQTYTFRDVTFYEAVKRATELKLGFVEGFLWQKLSPGHGETMLNRETPEHVLKEVSDKLKESRVKLVNAYVADFGKSEEDYRRVFAFGKKMGIETFVAEPPVGLLPILDKVASEYKMNVAIHNHPKNPEDASYVYWDPDQVMKAIKNLSERIGCCADTGHWVRSGLDPVECLKKYEGRLISLHLKDVDEAKVEGHDVPYGKGVGNIEGQLKELHRQKFSGVIAIEYETNPGNNTEDIQECIDFYTKVSRRLGVGGQGSAATQAGK